MGGSRPQKPWSSFVAWWLVQEGQYLRRRLGMKDEVHGWRDFFGRLPMDALAGLLGAYHQGVLTRDEVRRVVLEWEQFRPYYEAEKSHEQSPSRP